jgi:manganese transport protein
MTDPASDNLSLSEVHGSVETNPKRGMWRQLLAFSGPAYLVSVGYIDPGNWATDLAGGAQFGYGLIWVLLLSNLMAVLLQTLAARLGVATGRDLAQACRDHYAPSIRVFLWLLTEIAIAATDLAELLGTVIGLNLLFGLPLKFGVLITAGDTLLLLMLQRLGIRKIEAFVLALVTTIAMCFVVELFWAKPDWVAAGAGLVPRLPNSAALIVAIGIIGATVMPHNLYLHSALVQTRKFGGDDAGKRSACRYNLLDSLFALNGAFLVNAAILILAAAVFFGQPDVHFDEIQQAARMLGDRLGTRWGQIIFGVGLLASGQSSTLTGTLAGQVVMEGFVQIRVRPWVRRLATRSLAIIPAAVVIWLTDKGGAGAGGQGGDGGAVLGLMILSQVILSLQLPFAIVPLLHFTSSRKQMGNFANPAWLKVVAWFVAALIVALNVYLVADQFKDWATSDSLRPLVQFGLTPIALALGGFLLWMTLAPIRIPWRVRAVPPVLAAQPKLPPEAEAPVALLPQPIYRRIAVALENGPGDQKILRHALPLARSNNATLMLIHVVESPTTDVLGELTYDAEDRRDHEYMDRLAEQIRQVDGHPLPVEVYIGHGRAAEQILDILDHHRADLLVLGSHGHRRLLDLLFGETATAVRHALSIPVLTVK